MHQPLVTVLMPVYNAAKYLKDAINSILEQTYSNFEFIIIDDGSTDESLDIIKSFNDKRIKLFENGNNIKLIATLNKGIDLAQGKYIARMDADDISLPERFEKQINFMENNPNVGLCGTYIRAIGIEKNYDVHFKTTNEEIKFKLFFDTHFPHPAATIRTDVLRKNNLKFDNNYLHAEDFAFWNKLADYTELAIIPEILVMKRSHIEQVSYKFTAIQAQISSKIRRELIAKLGIIANDEEINNYDRLLLDDLPENKEDLFLLLDFIEKLIIANQQRLIYKRQLFEHFFANKYWDLCCFNTKYGITLLRKFQKSEASFILNLSLKTKTKFFIKVLFRYGKTI